MILMIAALLPAVFLVAYVYKKDTVEKEPRPLLVKLFFLGILAIVPAAVLELLLEGLLEMFCPPGSLISQLIMNFLIVAVMEEFWKRRVVLGAAWRHPAFNYRFDAVVYCVTAAMGFAALENVLYVADGGWSVALLRAVLAVPSHAVDAVLMGVFLGEAKVCEQRGDLGGRKKNLSCSLWIPVLAHGFYDFCLTRGSILSFLAFVLFVVFMDIFAVVQINRSSREDIQVSGVRGTELFPGEFMDS